MGERKPGCWTPRSFTVLPLHLFTPCPSLVVTVDVPDSYGDDLAGDALPWALVTRLWQAHGWGPVRDLVPLGGGQINRVYLVNSELVLRFRPSGKSAEGFLTEQTLLALLQGRVPVAPVVLADTTRRLVDADYLVTRRLPGQTLAREWLTATSGPRRRWLLRQWVELLRAIHEVRFPACGGFRSGALLPAPSWAAYLGERLQRRLALMRACPNADPDLLDAVAAYWRRHVAALACPPSPADPRLVHRDLHFANVLVEGERITGVLDFEAAVAAPIDYELDQIRRFLRWPALFLEPDLAPLVRREACEEVWEALRDGYPELFAVRDLTARLGIYSLEYDLAALRDAYQGRWGEAGLRHVVTRIEEVLEGRHWG
ncbi:MAG: phosphotransferase [Armatimonadetes bacterium]|nr:phosphotransferase [Armatimonadota bacterium]